MKILVALVAAIIAALFALVIKLTSNVSDLKNLNLQIEAANAELNATLSEVILQNERDTQILREKHEAELQNAVKTQKALNYAKTTDDSNVSKLFNDTILLLQQ